MTVIVSVVRTTDAGCFGRPESSAGPAGCLYSYTMLSLLLYVTAGCFLGDLRITGSNSFRSGRLEICSNNVWGQICDTQWDNLDAQVACRQLGYSPTGILVLY